MIRFPERFHASVTPYADGTGVEPNYQETPARASDGQPARKHVTKGVRQPNFDFSALQEAIGK